MADTHETSADIIAEMRRRIAVKMSDAWYTQEEWRKLCDRLEAAWKRESGDCAKLREALENLYDQICHGETEQHVAANRQMIRAALSAPPRNCDRFATADEAFHAWNNTVDTPGGGAYVGLMDWLFAPATEKEGGNDGNE
jgi:hypothetical protein